MTTIKSEIKNALNKNLKREVVATNAVIEQGNHVFEELKSVSAKKAADAAELMEINRKMLFYDRGTFWVSSFAIGIAIVSLVVSICAYFR
jgi:hypothetical protein